MPEEGHVMTPTTDALRWYAEQVEGCRKLGSIGDPYRHALDRDGGERARAALTAPAEPTIERPATLAELDAILNAPEPNVEVLPDGSCRPAPAPEERRQGHSKLVYDKATRSIVTVDTRPQPVGYATTEVRRNIFKHRFETICATPNETYPVALYDAPPPSPWRAVAEKFANSVRHLHGSFYDKRALEEYDALVAMQEHNDEDNILEARRPVDEGSQRHPLHRRPEPRIENTMEADSLGNVPNRPELNQGSASDSITWRSVADGLAEVVSKSQDALKKTMSAMRFFGGGGPWEARECEAWNDALIAESRCEDALAAYAAAKEAS